MQLNPKTYAKVWHELLENTPRQEQHAIHKKMLKHVYQNGKLSWLGEIVNHIENIEHETNNTTSVTITSSHEISDHMAKEIVKDLMPEENARITKKIEKKWQKKWEDKNAFVGCSYTFHNAYFFCSFQD